MANSAQARKRARQATERRSANVGERSKVRTHIKKVVRAIESGDRAAAESAYREAVPVLDHGAGNGIIHKNAAARHKSRLNTRIRAL